MAKRRLFEIQQRNYNIKTAYLQIDIYKKLKIVLRAHEKIKLA